MTTARRSERGLSMVEVLVAITVLVVAATIALLIYDASRKSFKRGENVTEQQQAVRIAFDRLTSDLRMAGFNYNPDGDTTRPDEQIEAAYDTAVVIRADFDAEDPSASTTPESTLKGGAFLTVSTGNDEIVAYVLAKPDGSSTDTLTFEADVQEAPRDGDVETINIPNVALVQNNPPYTLYRITLSNNGASLNSSSFFTRTPLVENVRSMAFRYYNQVGSQVNATFDLTSTSDDIGGADGGAPEAQRKGIRRIGIELVGLTRDPDLDWVDTTDTNPSTRKFRKFPLNGDVTPRNLGMVGIQDLMADVTPPSKPATPTLVPGHCGGLFAFWAANPVADQVASYRVNIGPSAGSYTDTRATAATSLYIGGLTTGSTYHAVVQAVDAAGNLSVPSNDASATVQNLNTPQAPVNPAATSNLTGAVKVTWDAVTANTTAIPAQDPNLRDLAGYRVYRSLTSGFTPSGTPLADESIVGNKPSPDYTDQNVVNCRTYYYKITAVDLCGLESAVSSEASGLATSNIAPKKPTNVQAFFLGSGQVKITWDAVTQDVSDNTITVENYKVFRSTLVPNTVKPIDASSFTYRATVTNATQFIETLIVPLGYTYWYAVSAVDDCPNESERSDPARPECAFSGDVVFSSPNDGQPVAGVVPVNVSVINSTDTISQMTLEFYNEANARVEHTEVITTACDASASPSNRCDYTYDWLANPPGPYTITATAQNAYGCSKVTSIHVASGFDVGCCLSPPDPDVRPIVLSCLTSGPSPQQCKEITWPLINNNCLTAVAIEQIDLTWVDAVGNGAKLTTVRFDGSAIWNVTPPSLSPASNVFSDPKPAIPVSRNSSNPVDVTYVFDQVTSTKSGKNFLRDSLTTSFSFRLLDSAGMETPITGVCGPSTGMFDTMVVEQHN